MSTKLLQPETQPTIKDKLFLSKDKQASYYNKVSQPLPAIQPGDVVRFKLPGKDTWMKALCKSQIAPRSYTVECNGKIVDVIVKISDTQQKHWNQPLEIKLIVTIVFLWRSNQ